MSVKTPVADWARANESRVGMLSLNPLFAPDLGFASHLVAAVSLRPGGNQSGLVQLLERAGSTVLVMSADAHDRDTAATQTLTHAAVLAVARALDHHADGPTPRTATPPHCALLLLVGRILSGSPAVYWAIQHTNPHSRHARHLLIDALSEIDVIVNSGDQAAFERLIEGLRAGIRPELDQMAQDGAAMLASVPVTSTGRQDRA
jgi:prephenate dehydrogenase